MDTPTEWLYEDPVEPGIYAVSVCWDAEEGVIPEVAVWNGKEWAKDWPIMCCAGPFEDEASASSWAYDHDLEGI